MMWKSKDDNETAYDLSSGNKFVKRLVAIRTTGLSVGKSSSAEQ